MYRTEKAKLLLGISLTKPLESLYPNFMQQLYSVVKKAIWTGMSTHYRSAGLCLFKILDDIVPIIYLCLYPVSWKLLHPYLGTFTLSLLS